MALDLVTIEHSPHAEVLTQPAAEVAFPLSSQDEALIAEMKAMLLKLKGVGLAAPQVGVSKRIIVLNIDEEAKGLRKDAKETVPLTVLINPAYSPLPGSQKVQDWEGCFSVAETTGKVPRYDKITYTAQTPDGKTVTATAEGFTARVLQHEIDHIQGILIVDRLTSDCLQGHPSDLMALRVKELTPEQREIMKKIVAESEKSLDPKNTIRKDQLAKLRKLLEEL